MGPMQTYIIYVISLCSLPLQAGTCHYKGEAVSMMYYRLLDGGENEILNTVAGLSPVLVSIDHRTRTFMVNTYTIQQQQQHTHT